jgi:hypothetical protein
MLKIEIFCAKIKIFCISVNKKESKYCFFTTTHFWGGFLNIWRRFCGRNVELKVDHIIIYSETSRNVHGGCELVITNWSFCVISTKTIWWTHENIMKPSEINMTFSHHLLFNTTQALCSRFTSIVKCDHYGIQGHGAYHYYSLPPNLNSNNIGLGWELYFHR